MSEFNKLWEFEDGQEVCIKHSRKNKKFLRIEPGDKDDIDWEGGLGGKRAVWKVHIDSETNLVQFESTLTGKFLNMDKGKGWGCSGGKGGSRAVFKMERYGKGSAILRSDKDPDRCVGSKNADPRPVQIYTQGDLNNFSNPFELGDADKQVIIIQHSQTCDNLRIKKKDVIMNQGTAFRFAQWKFIATDDGKYRMKSVKNGEFLRIAKNGKEVNVGGKKDGHLTAWEIEEVFDEMGQHVQLKSVATGAYLGVTDDRKVVGMEEPDPERTRFTMFCGNETEDDEDDE